MQPYFDINDRVKYVIQHKGMNPSEFSRFIGMENNVTIHKMISNKQSPSIDVIVKICNKIPEISAEWLLTGKGNMIMQNEDAITMVNDMMTEYRVLNKLPDVIETKKEFVIKSIRETHAKLAYLEMMLKVIEHEQKLKGL